MNNIVSRIANAAATAAEGYADLVVETAKLRGANRKLRDLDYHHSEFELKSNRADRVQGFVLKIAPMIIEYAFQFLGSVPKNSETTTAHAPSCPKNTRHAAVTPDHRSESATKPNGNGGIGFVDERFSGAGKSDVELLSLAVHLFAALERDAAKRGKLDMIEKAIVTLDNYLIDPDFMPSGDYQGKHETGQPYGVPSAHAGEAAKDSAASVAIVGKPSPV